MKRTVLGLYLSGESVQALALEHTPTGALVQALAEWSSTLFNYAGEDTPGVDEFVEHLSTFVRNHNLSPMQVSVTLDSALLFMNSIPMRNSSTPIDIEDQLRWELNEYFPTAADSFITDMHVLTPKSEAVHGTVLMVSAGRDVVQKIRRSLSRLQLRLDIVDVDHFSADTALRYNYPDTLNKQLALVGIKEHRLDVSLVRHNETESYNYFLPTSSDEILQRISRIASETKGLSSISVYGTHLTREILSQLRETTSTPIEAVNPFRSIDVASSVRLNGDPTMTSYRYCPLVGVSLRRD